jgi:type I restriction enzyme S subunit
MSAGMKTDLPTMGGSSAKGPNDWKIVRLGDYVTKVGSGVTPRGGSAVYQDSGIPLIRSQNVLMNRFSSEGLAYVSRGIDAQMSNSRVQRDDVLLNITGAYIGRVCVVPPEVCPANVNQHVCIIRSDGSMDSDYLCLFLSSPRVQELIMNRQAGGTRQALTKAMIEDFRLPLPSLAEQRRIAAELKEQLAEVERARKAVEEQQLLAEHLRHSFIRESLAAEGCIRARISDCLVEVKEGVGQEWSGFPVLGATRHGLAPAKEKVGKNPERYKAVNRGAIFYNPMRILLGSIAMVDDEDSPGITSPDYVVMSAREGVLHPRWFYNWFRSDAGAEFIRSLTRGAVRERLMFRRLAPAEITAPSRSAQCRASVALREVRSSERALVVRLTDIEKLPAALLWRAFGG